MLAINRFRVASADEEVFLAGANAAVAHFAGSPGNLSAELLRNLDDPQLWALVTRWMHIGAYRRSLSGVPARLALWPLLGDCLDEPGCYATPEEVGDNQPRSNP